MSADPELTKWLVEGDVRRDREVQSWLEESIRSAPDLEERAFRQESLQKWREIMRFKRRERRWQWFRIVWPWSWLGLTTWSAVHDTVLALRGGGQGLPGWGAWLLAGFMWLLVAFWTYQVRKVMRRLG